MRQQHSKKLSERSRGFLSNLGVFITNGCNGFGRGEGFEDGESCKGIVKGESSNGLGTWFLLKIKRRRKSSSSSTNDWESRL